MTAIAMGALAVVNCSAPSRCPAGASCPSPPLPRLTYVMTINGQSVSLPKGGPVPRYHVRPGEHLLMKVAVTVPRHLRVMALWLGISTGTWGSGPKGRPVGMHPVLAHSRQSLSAGVHRFGLRWRVPEHPAPYWPFSLYVVSASSSHQPPAEVAGPIADLALR